NRNLDFIYVLTRDRAAKEHHQADIHMMPKDVEVPFVCQFIPMRWSYEAMVVAQAKLNPFTRRQDIITEKIGELAKKQVLTEAESNRLDDLKETLAILSGLAGANTAQIDAKLRGIDQIISGGPLDRTKFESGGDRVTAEELFQNQKITDMLTDAQMKQKDYTSAVRNVFFGPDKYYFGQKLNVFVFNSWIINGFTVLFLLLLLLSLHRQLRTN
ncbi:MAG TPA: hypothetical protein VE154_01635, partial [Chthoniobacterales bacterium]|nr:hypothetical protein [Chthoniobacterales bacterium]